MHDIYSRHRPLALLAAVVLAQVLLLAFQVRRGRPDSSTSQVRLVRFWAVEMLTPVERVGTWTFSEIRAVWRGYLSLHDARGENERLRAEVEQLRLRNRELESRAAEAQRLAVLLNFREAHPEALMLAAQVIGASADPASHTLFLNRGERDRVRRNLPVITPDGVVGKIVEVFPSTSQVLLINDKDSGIGALFADTRVHGVVKGNGDPEPRMEYVSNDEKVQVGETILTSGEDRIFPKGLLIGTVASATPGNPLQVIRISTAVQLDRLEEVLVLLSPQELAPRKSEAASIPQPTPPPAPSLKDVPAASGGSAAHPATKPAPAPARTAAPTGSLRWPP